MSHSPLQKQEADAVFPGGPESYWTLGIGLVATIFAASYVGKLAKVCFLYHSSGGYQSAFIDVEYVVNHPCSFLANVARHEIWF